MHYYSHHIGDFIKATARLSDSQAMAYLRILWLYYDKDGIIEHDIEQIAFEIGSEPKTVELIIKTYFQIEGDFIKQSRCDKEIAGYLKKSTGGKEGASKRWKNKDSDSLPNDIPNSLPNAEAMPTQCNPNANQEPITNNQQPINKTHTTENLTAGNVCVLLKSFGIASVNPSHPKLMRLLEMGATAQDFESAAITARDKEKGFAYVLGVVEGQKADAKKMNSGTSRQKFDPVAFVNQGREAAHAVIDIN